MIPIDLREEFDKYLLDNKRSITKTHLNSVCKYKNGEKTCKYIFMYKNKFLCVKNTPLRDFLDKMANDGKMTARGNNCEGLGKFKK